MKTYNALSKSFTDEVKTIMGVGKSIDDAFELVKRDIVGDDFDEPTVTPESTPTPSPTPTPTPTPVPESTPTPSPGSTPTPSPDSTPAPEIDINRLTQGDGQQDGYYYVDLGLSVKWATCNVGSTLASDEGKLFQFGRVDGYRYNDSNNQFRTNAQNKQDTGSSYIPLTASGKTYNAGEILNQEDDAAYIGGIWRMPNRNDLDNLYTYTTHEVKKIGNTSGMLFTSIINNKQLFIPFAGSWSGNFYNNGSSAFVWSSQVHPSNADSAFRLYCDSSGDAGISDNNRSFAFSVRGVFNE